MNKILLTSTIDTNNCSYVMRNNIEDRKNDLLNSLQKWIENTSYDIILIENSGFDLSFIKKQFENYSNRIEYISYSGNYYPRSFGKGYGEALSIIYAIDNSYKLRYETHFTKCTGRYYLKNLNNIFNNLELKKYDLIVYKRQEDQNLIPTSFFYSNKKLIYDFLIKNIQNINDSGGRYIEHIFYDFFNNIENKYIIQEPLGLDGISGTANIKINWMF